MPNLTKTFIDRLEHNGKSQHIVYDAAIPGFGVRVYPTGRKAFVFRSESPTGKRSPKVIGEYGILTLDQAREVARELRRKTKLGIDIWKKAPTKPTVREVWEIYWEKHGSKKRSAEAYRYMAECFILPAWGDRIAEEIGYTAAIELHESIMESRFKRVKDKAGEERFPKAKGGPYIANRVMALVSKVWNLAAKRQVIPANSVNPARGIDKAPEEKRKRYLKPDELPRVGVAIRSLPRPADRGVLLGLLLTVCRKTELAYAELSELFTVMINGQEVLVLGIPPERTKNGQPKFVVIHEELKKIIYSIPRRAGEKYIFPGTRKDGTVNVNGAWRRVREAAGIPDVRVHDLRHTGVSLMVQNGVSLSIAGEAAGHQDPRVTFGYAHLALASVFQATRTLTDTLAPHLLEDAAKAVPEAEICDAEILG